MKLMKPCLIFLVIVLSSSTSLCEEEWQKWDSYPKVPRITAQEAKQMMLNGEKMIFVYAGYAVKEIVCGSLYIPYTKVPPSSDGSSVRFPFSKDYWIMCY